MTTTDLERKLIRNIAENEYAPGNGARPTTFAECGAVWSNCLECGPEAIAKASLPGALASLVKKGLAWQEGRGKEATTCLTEAGFATYLTLRGNQDPREIAVLCALRSDGRSIRNLRDAIGDGAVSSTQALLVDMQALGLVALHGFDWYLTPGGVAWLEAHGLHAEQRARRPG